MNTEQVPHDLMKYIREHERYLIIGHSEPDGDCIGSETALARYLERIGKTAHLFSPGPFQRPEILQFEELFQLHIPEELKGGDTSAVILDCSTLERIGDLAEEIAGLPLIVIDHHSAGEDFGDLRYIDSAAPSVTFMIQKLIEAMGDTPDTDEARLLLFGLCTDTGFFRHLPAYTGEVFEAVGRLVERGTSTREIHTMVYGNRSIESRKLLGLLLSRVERHFDGKLLLTWEKLDDTREHGFQNRDSDTLYQQLQSVRGCEVVVLIREEFTDNDTPKLTCSAGLRSRKNDYDVGAVARSFGGGGHRQAAGFSKPATIEELRTQLLESFSALFS